MQDRLEEDVRISLRFGFPLLPDAAASYVEGLLDPALAAGNVPDVTADAVLDGIVARMLERRGATEVVVPLTAGNDSRALLGAALRVAGRDRITAVTFGDADHSDVVGAKAAAEAVGVRWIWIDPTQTPWALDPILDCLDRTHARTGSYGSLAVVRLLQIEDLLGTDTLVLSGYFGDAITGAHLATQTLSAPRAILDFILHNITFMDVDFDIARVWRCFEAYLARLAPYEARFASLTKVDLLDFGFRQHLRIKGQVAAFRQVAFPFEDPDWVAFWLQQPLEARIGQRLYRAGMIAGYDSVFSLPHDRAYRPAPVPPAPSLPRRARQWMLQQSPARVWHRHLQGHLERRKVIAREPAGHESRDFEVNASCRATFDTLCKGFDQRGLLPDLAMGDALERFEAAPTKGALSDILNVTRTELHLRLGLPLS